MSYETSLPPEEGNLEFKDFSSNPCPKCGGSCSSGGCNSGGPYTSDEKKQQDSEYTAMVTKAPTDKDGDRDTNGGYGYGKDGAAHC